MDSKRFDSIIFDMDGTLWDAVDSYCAIWNVSLRECGFDHADITRRQLTVQMGYTIDRIIADLIPEAAGSRAFLEALERNESRLMPRLGGRLYPGVRETITALAEHHRLFLVSNCSADGLPNFMKFTGLEPWFTDSLSYGQTGRGKADNIKALCERYGLQSPLYAGDTQSDANACLSAGVPIAWASYGFGHIDRPDYTLNVFEDIKNIVS